MPAFPETNACHAVSPAMVRSWPFSLLVYNQHGTILLQCSACPIETAIRAARRQSPVPSRPLPAIHLSSAVSQPASNSSQLLDIHHHRGTSSNSTATVANEPNNKFQPRETFIKRESSSICQCTIHHPPINIPSDRLR